MKIHKEEMMDKEEQRHKRRLRAIRERGKRTQRRLELREAREKYMPRKKRLTTAKTALLYIFISCTAVQIYAMFAMWHFADLSALYSLIGATVGETISYCAYAAKSARENSQGGIVYDMAVKGQEGAPEASEEASGEAKG